MLEAAKGGMKLAVLGAAAIFLPATQGRLDSLDSRLLATHNHERELIGVPSLIWNDDLASGAEKWAKHLAENGKFEHSPNRPGEPLQGENIWGGSPGAFTPESMVGLWIDEKAAFIPATFPSNSTTGRVKDVSHYTQVVWKETREVGCALARGAREEILVCRYSRPGNIVGHRPF